MFTVSDVVRAVVLAVVGWLAREALTWLFRQREAKMVEVEATKVEPFMTTREVAAWLRVSTRCIAGWVSDGTIPAHRLGKSLLRFKRSEVAKALGLED